MSITSWKARWSSGAGTQLSVVVFAVLMLMTMAGGGSAVKLLCPALITLGAFYLCSKAPTSYVELLIWTFILSPGLRHYVDFHTGFSQTNPIMLAPYCVVFSATGPVLRHLINGRRYTLEMLVLILAVTAGVGISVGTGAIKDPLLSAMRWLAPIWCALYICANSDRLSEIRQSVRRVFTLAVPAVAIYGIVQFVAILPWDVYYMEKAPINSIGYPEPFLVRVFSTMNSPGSLAAMLCTGMLLMLPKVRILIWVVGLIALSLTTQRAALGAFVVAVLVLAMTGRDRVLRRNLIKLGASLVVAVTLVLSVPGSSKKLMGSATSISHLQDDNSAQDRWKQYTAAGAMLDGHKAGRGLGWSTNDYFITVGRSIPIDSGLLDTFISLGIVGGSLFLFTLLALAGRGWHIARQSLDSAASGEFTAALFGIAQLPFGDQQTGEHGVFLYLALGLLLARPLAASLEPGALQAIVWFKPHDHRHRQPI